jgi:uncharacterized protein (TIGR03435 family)
LTGPTFSVARLLLGIRAVTSSDQELKHMLEGMDQGPSIFVFFQDQLGLKLESRKAPVEMLIVDSAQKIPADN